MPCAFGVLTVDTMEQALERSGGGKRDSGRHAAEAVLALARLREQLGAASDASCRQGRGKSRGGVGLWA